LRSYADIMAELDFFTPHWGLDYRGVDASENLTPAAMSGSTAYNWGGNLKNVMQDACLALMSDSFSAAQKEAICTRLFSIGHQIHAPANGKDFADPYHYQGNGAIWQFHLGAVAVYLQCTGQTEKLASLLDDLPGNFKGAFKVTQALKDRMVPHDSNTEPSGYRRRTVHAVNGNDVTFEGFSSGVESYRQNYEGLTLTNGTVSSTITAMPDNVTGAAPDALTATLADASGFSASDEVWVTSPFERAVGDYDWAIWEVPERFNGYYQSVGADYRSLNKWSGFVLFLQAAGIMHPNFEAIREYVVGANTPNFPDASFDWPNHHHSTWAEEFWADHWAAISAVPQIHASSNLWAYGDMETPAAISTGVGASMTEGVLRYSSSAAAYVPSLVNSNYFIPIPNDTDMYMALDFSNVVNGPYTFRIQLNFFDGPTTSDTNLGYYQLNGSTFVVSADGTLNYPIPAGSIPSGSTHMQPQLVPITAGPQFDIDNIVVTQ
jgi:hypothetical protein